MNYYPHHIGDFDRATRHLTRLERSIYRDLMDVYYDTEQVLTLDQPALCRKIIARSPDEVAAVTLVLNDFFVETPAGWFHDRCEEELATYRKNNSQKSQAGKASAAARAERRQQAINGISTAVPTAVARQSNGTPTNQEPEPEPEPELEPKKARSTASGSRLPDDWKPNAADVEYCKTERPDLLPSKVAQNFYDYWISIPGAKGRKLNWSATWRTWVRKEDVKTAGRPAGNVTQFPGARSVTEQNDANTAEAKRLLFGGPKPKDDNDNDEGMVLEHA